MSEPTPILIILATSDLQRSVAFYERVFGWQRHVDVPVYVEFDVPGGRGLGLYVREGFGRNAGHVPPPVAEGAISGTEIYLRCRDLEGVIDRLQAEGARELSPLTARDWGDDVAYYGDPDGNVLAVARPTSP